MHKITNLWKFELNWSSKLQDMEEKTSSHELQWFQMLEFETLNSKSELSNSNSTILVRNNFFENNITSEGAVSHNVSHYQHLAIASKFFMLIKLSFWAITKSIQCL